MMATHRLFKRPVRRSVLDTVTGALLCTWLSLTVMLVGQNILNPLRLLALFVPAVGLVAWNWGLIAAMLGLVSIVFVSCVAIFAPVGRMDVASADARTSLFWMVVCAGVAGYVFARPQSGRRELHQTGRPRWREEVDSAATTH